MRYSKFYGDIFNVNNENKKTENCVKENQKTNPWDFYLVTTSVVVLTKIFLFKKK